MPGIQALERKMPDIEMKPGRCVKHEFEYIRHGTQTLIASFNVATGEIALATVEDTRTEKDFAESVRSGSPIGDKLRKTEVCQGEKEKMSNSD
jgi:hypothetical protein